MGRVEGFDGVLEERTAAARGGVRPEGQRDGAVGGRAIAGVAAAAAARAGGGGQDDAEAECGYRRSGGFLHHRRNSLTENWVPRLLRRRSAGAAATDRLLRMVFSWGLDTSHFRKFSRNFRRAVIVRTSDSGVNPPFPWRYEHFHHLTIRVRCCENSAVQSIYATEKFRD